MWSRQVSKVEKWTLILWRQMKTVKKTFVIYQYMCWKDFSLCGLYDHDDHNCCIEIDINAQQQKLNYVIPYFGGDRYEPNLIWIQAANLPHLWPSIKRQMYTFNFISLFYSLSEWHFESANNFFKIFAMQKPVVGNERQEKEDRALDKWVNICNK